MLKQVAEGVWAHESDFLQSNAVVVQGKDGVLLIDPGITSDEMAVFADDLQKLGQPVVAGFSTHPHWDHLLWHAKFGEAPRYGTTRGAAEIQNFLSNADWKSQVAPMLPQDIADQIPMDDLFGKITGLPAGTTQLAWDGPTVRIIEHQGHAAGSAALLIKERGVLVAGDMLSDILIPFLELDAEDPTADYLAALDLLEGMADDIKIFIPGHGSVGDADEMRARINQDRAYVQALRDGSSFDDPRLTTSPSNDAHKWQLKQLAKKSEHDGTPSK
jgi:glyoxylase-like metal-dependent hydrolase (beta-lactamase superfamily II)